MKQFEREYQLSLYEPLAKLNQSPKSEVLFVRNSLTGKVYIKKTLRHFNREVFKILKEIKTTHMPKIYDIFECDETLIIIEEFINGQTLEELIHEQGRLEEAVAIRYMITLCEVLSQLHQQKSPLIHRDLKPSNVMISNDGVLKLIDFDVSRIYRQDCNLDTQILGTKGYASPEQFGFEQTDARSDIYSMGVMLNVLVTGSNPKEKCPHGKLGAIIKKCTYLSPEQRYQTVDELKQDLSELISKSKVVSQENEIEQDNKKRNWFLLIFNELLEIPGYRRKFLPNMIIATYWYAFLFIGMFSEISISNMAMASALFLMTLLNGNYKDIWNKNSLLIENRKVGLVILNLLIIFFFGGFI